MSFEHVQLQCPYCFESMEMGLDPQSVGSMVVDCDVCCRPWELTVWSDEDGQLHARAERG